MDKKDQFRFTIRFDEADPMHLRTAEILGRLGRKKARYVANAVCFYENAFEHADRFDFSGRMANMRTTEVNPETVLNEERKRDKKVLMNQFDQSDIAVMKNGANAFRRR